MSNLEKTLLNSRRPLLPNVPCGANNTTCPLKRSQVQILPNRDGGDNRDSVGEKMLVFRQSYSQNQASHRTCSNNYCVLPSKSTSEVPKNYTCGRDQLYCMSNE